MYAKKTRQGSPTSNSYSPESPITHLHMDLYKPRGRYTSTADLSPNTRQPVNPVTKKEHRATCLRKGRSVRQQVHATVTCDPSFLSLRPPPAGDNKQQQRRFLSPPVAQTTPKQTAATADATVAQVTPPLALTAPPTAPVLMLEGGFVPPVSPIARAPGDGARVAPPGSGTVGPATAGAMEAEEAAGAGDPKTRSKEEGTVASVGPAGIGLVEKDGMGAVVSGNTNTKPPGGIVMKGVTGAVEAAAGIDEGEATGAVDTSGAGAAVPGEGRKWTVVTRVVQTSERSAKRKSTGHKQGLW